MRDQTKDHAQILEQVCANPRISHYLSVCSALHYRCNVNISLLLLDVWCFPRMTNVSVAQMRGH